MLIWETQPAKFRQLRIILKRWKQEDLLVRKRKQ